jgi:hypothetical protein
LPNPFDAQSGFPDANGVELRHIYADFVSWNARVLEQGFAAGVLFSV